MRRRSILVGSLLLAATTLIATAAWACTEFTSLVAPKSAAATAMVELTATGRAAPEGKAVEVRWNDVKGPLVATAQGEQINQGISAALPSAPDGVYFLVAVVDGRGVARTSIEMRTPGAAPAPVDNRPVVVGTDSTPAATTSTSPEMLGVGLLAVGSVALLGGALFLTVRRKVVRVDSPGSTESIEG